MKLALIMALPLAAFALPAAADGSRGPAPWYICGDGSAVSVYDRMGPRYVCALRERAVGEYRSRREDMDRRGFERKMDTLRSIDDNALKNGW